MMGRKGKDCSARPQCAGGYPRLVRQYFFINSPEECRERSGTGGYTVAEIASLVLARRGQASHLPCGSAERTPATGRLRPGWPAMVVSGVGS